MKKQQLDAFLVSQFRTKMEYTSAINDKKCDQDQWEQQSNHVQMVSNEHGDEGEVVTITEEEVKSDAAVSKDTVKGERSRHSWGIFDALRAKIGSATEEKEEKKKKKERKKSDDKRQSLDSFHTGDQTDSDNDEKAKCVVRSNSSAFYDSDEKMATSQYAKDKDEGQEEENTADEKDKNNTRQEQGKYKDKPSEESSERAEEKDTIKSIK